ncbi:terpenoid synthase [Fistulina hepatica ATCC 64428]|uniref:Terpene synthase n=1 Tax=Fistulina hepatica ATCC 64428 TaxID=1128425 RepID=A0A0D7A848_9AGAR|nr:terpenoid synthase [Fistulina hepatica ATCC 64428]
MASIPCSVPAVQEPATKATDFYILPDLAVDCPFPLAYHVDGDIVDAQSSEWLDKNSPELTPKQRAAIYRLQAGKLTAFCFKDASTPRLRVIADFLTYLFHLDNVSDGMLTNESDVLSDTVMNALFYSESYRPTKGQPEEEITAGKLARDFWMRCLPDAGPGIQKRFLETLQMFFESVSVQAKVREEGNVPDMESYIDIRRDNSGCKPCWALIEYGLGIELPEEVTEDPIILALGESANDWVTWTNDLFSYNVEQARGDEQLNMVYIFMYHHGKTLQEAIDCTAELCRHTVHEFLKNKALLPSWGPEIDDMVRRYVIALEDWIVGSLNWSFLTERYFGKSGAEIKKSRVVHLLPRVNA